MSFKDIHEVVSTDDAEVTEFLDGMVHDAASAMASAANNGGVTEQVTFLKAAGWSPQEIVSALNSKQDEGEVA